MNAMPRLDKQVEKRLAVLAKEQVIAQRDNLIGDVESIVLMVLNTVFGFGPIKMRRFHDQFEQYYDDLVDHYSSGKDAEFFCQTYLKEHYGIDVKEWNDENQA